MTQKCLWTARDLLTEKSDYALRHELAALAAPTGPLSGQQLRRRRRRRAAIRAEMRRRKEKNDDRQ
jgi:hypothetical protein